MRLVPVDAKSLDWPRKIANAINYLLNKVEGVTGMKDTANSTTTALGSGETYTGSWVANDHAQIAFNCLSDTDGTLYIEFALDEAGALQTLSKSYTIYADDPQFDALVKMPGRYHRVRFVNSASAQTDFGLTVSTANDGLYPYAISDRDAPAFAACGASSVGATQYQILVDLSDRTNFPHHFTGRVDLYGAFFSVDRGTNTVGAVRIGVITRIDGTDADIEYVQGVSFNNAADKTIVRDRIFENPIRCGQSGGSLTRVATNFTATGVTAVNTGASLTNAIGGTSTPAVGDIVATFEFTSGTAYTAGISAQYATSSSTT